MFRKTATRAQFQIPALCPTRLPPRDLGLLVRSSEGPPSPGSHWLLRTQKNFSGLQRTSPGCHLWIITRLSKAPGRSPYLSICLDHLWVASPCQLCQCLRRMADGRFVRHTRNHMPSFSSQVVKSYVPFVMVHSDRRDAACQVTHSLLLSSKAYVHMCMCAAVNQTQGLTHAKSRNYTLHPRTSSILFILYFFFF